MKGTTLRQSFIDFFSERGHTVVSSDSLIPTDPTLLFTSAGMVQFKKLWSGEVQLPYRRATSIQKCLRVSDLEEVGRSLKYNTFFEMLGNFSFGDYFKREAISWAWEFITEVINLPKENLYVSVLREDEEAYKIWKDEIGIKEKRIYRLGKEDNFWAPVGGRGACGPCSEIFYDLGEDVGCGKPDCRPGCGCDRFSEVWNLVFPQYDSGPDGKLKPLKNRGIDTGMGLERLAMVVQGKKSIFLTDLFKPIVEEASRICGVRYEEHEITINILADHIKALTFAIADGVMPSNEGRGYVLRRILRRAARYGRSLGMHQPFLHRLVERVVNCMGDAYPELNEKEERVSLVVKDEEESFGLTLDRGLEIFEEIVAHGGKAISGEDAFRLYDTYGFPLDLTQLLAKERGLEVDTIGFEQAMARQRKRARAASRLEVGDEERFPWKEVSKGKSSQFVGYERLSSEAEIRKFREREGRVELILSKTPFYGEAGGQVGDRGWIRGEGLEVEVEDAVRSGDEIIHCGRIKSGHIKEFKGEVVAEVDQECREAIQRNHTATHLLQLALREILGEHVSQSGSYVGPDRLRFDFSHPSAVDRDTLDQIEERVNEWIMENSEVQILQTTLKEAKKMGALAFFGEKYGEKVRAVRIGEYSLELCGGTHLRSTGEIGLFKLAGESSVASGIRRIEALTGQEALRKVRENEGRLREIAELLKSSPDRVEEKLRDLLQEAKDRERELRSLRRKDALSRVDEILKLRTQVGEVSLISSRLDDLDERALREISDLLLKRMGSGVITLGSRFGNQVIWVVKVSRDMVAQGLHAGTIVKEVAGLTGGSGGGKAEMARGGGKDVSKLDDALHRVPKIIAAKRRE